MHCDSLTALSYPQLRSGEGQLDLTRLQAPGALQCFAIFLPKRLGDLYQRTLTFADLFDRMVAENPDLVMAVRTPEDYRIAVEKGRLAAMLTIEEGATIEGDIAKLRHLYSRGVRMMTLTWNYPNEIGYPNLDINEYSQNRLSSLYRTDPRPLTEFGRQVVAEMNALGMMVDVSHLSDGGFWDVLSLSTKPIVASHSNARAVCPVARNLTDPMLVALAEHGGITGLNLCPDFLRAAPTDDLLQSAVRHVLHIHQVAGEDVLAIGTDFDGIHALPPLEGCQQMPLLHTALLEHLPSRVVDKMWTDNFLRVWQENQPTVPQERA